MITFLLIMLYLASCVFVAYLMGRSDQGEFAGAAIAWPVIIPFGLLVLLFLWPVDKGEEHRRF